MASTASGDQLFDRYLDSLLRGEAIEPEEFLSRHGHEGEELRLRFRAMYDVLRGPGGSTSDTVPSAEEGLPFDRLAGFRLLRTLGDGGMGRVYLAEQESLGRLVALKVVRPENLGSPVAIERFRREARALAQVRHPNVVGVYGFGEDQGVNYMAMELVPGKSLGQRLRDGPPVPPSTAVRWANEIARALEATHERGILHRDVKPSNIRITPEERAVLVDFGLARDLESEGVKLTQAFAGSPAYASPEQVRGDELDLRSDVYSLGITLYEALTGSAPFRSSSMEAVFRSVLHDEPTHPRRLNREIPRDLEVVVQKAIEKDRETRYASAAAFAGDLQALLEFRAISARPPGALRRAMRWARRRPKWAAAIGALSLTAVGITAALVTRARLDKAEREERAGILIEQAFDRIDEDRAQWDLIRDATIQVDGIQAGFDDSGYLDPAEYDKLDRLEDDVAAAVLQREKIFTEVHALLYEAERLDPKVERGAEVRAELYLTRAEESLERGDYAAAEIWMDEVDRWDDGGARASRFPEGKVVFTVTGATAPVELHAFQYREHRRIVTGGEARQVPVPIGDVALPVEPGTWALRVVRGAGALDVGDHIFEIAGHPIEHVAIVSRGNDAVAKYDRLVSVDGAPVDGDWEIEEAREESEVERAFLFHGADGAYTLNATSTKALGIEVVEPDDLARIGDVPVRWLSHGALVDGVLPHGADVRTTAAPLIVMPELAIDFVDARGEIALRPGHYLFLIRSEGSEDLRYPSSLSNPFAREFRLYPKGTSPPGFLRVEPNIPDPKSFWILEREISSLEYAEFVNALPPDERDMRAPTVGDREIWTKEDGVYHVPERYRDLPAVGFSLHDAKAYVAWRNAEARRQGLPYTYRLPTWTDHGPAGTALLTGRTYSWGPTWRPYFSNTCWAKPRPRSQPSFRFPIDESPFGAFDFCGGTMEWMDRVWDIDGRYHAAGGAWAEAGPIINRVYGGYGYPPNFRSGQVGMRLVLEIDP